jgi:hypothetical protein
VKITSDGFDWATLANYLLVIVGIGGISVAWATLRKIERQTKAAEDSASAALLGVQAVMITERARMAVTASPLGNYSLEFNATNIGRSSAKVIRDRNYSVFFDGAELPNQKPVYLNEEPINEQYSEWVAPGGAFQLLRYKEDGTAAPNLIADLSADATRNNLRYHGCSMWVYGQILYYDGLSPERRELRFCYQILVDSSGNTRYKTGGPPEYLLDT